MNKASITDETSDASAAQATEDKEEKQASTEASHHLMATLDELVKEELQMIDDWAYSFELEEKLAVASQKSASGNEDSKSESWDEPVFSKSEDKDSLVAQKSRHKKNQRMEILE